MRITRSGSGKRAGEQAGGEQFGGDGFGIEPAFGGGARQFAGGIGDLFLAAIVEGEGEIEALVVDGAGFGILDHLLDVAGDAAAMADDAHARAFVHQLVHVAAEEGAEQRHQGARFRSWAASSFR